MGGFEIILVFIGVVWSIASAIVQNKKKRAAAKKRAMLMEESVVSPREEFDQDPQPDTRVEAAAPASPSIQSLFQGSLSDRFEAIKLMRIERMKAAEASMEATAGSPPGPVVQTTAQVPIPIQPTVRTTSASNGPQMPSRPPRRAPKATQTPESSSHHEESMSLSSWHTQAKHDEVASKLHEAIRSKSSLRAAFVLKEVLDPPLALRPGEI